MEQYQSIIIEIKLQRLVFFPKYDDTLVVLINYAKKIC